MFAELLQRAWRKYELHVNPISTLRTALWQLRGARIGEGTRLPRSLVTWPHQVQMGRDCILQPDVFFNYDHFWTRGPSIILGDRVFVGRGVEFNIQDRIEIGDDALIASGCVFIDHDHGTAPAAKMNTQPNVIARICIGTGTWIGTRSVVLKGVKIGKDSVIGAGSIVTKSVPSGEVWAGNPARFLRYRQSSDADIHEGLVSI